MVDIVGAASPAHYCVTVRPNCSLPAAGHFYFLALTLPAYSLIAVGFTLLGAWPVVPFFLLALAALAHAFYQMWRHAGDFERITIDDDKLILESHNRERDEHYEFNCYWAKVVLREEGIRGHCHLSLCSHGREVPFGHLLSDDERAMVGRELYLRLSGFRR